MTTFSAQTQDFLDNHRGDITLELAHEIIEWLGGEAAFIKDHKIILQAGGVLSFHADASAHELECPTHSLCANYCEYIGDLAMDAYHAKEKAEMEALIEAERLAEIEFYENIDMSEFE